MEPHASRSRTPEGDLADALRAGRELQLHTLLQVGASRGAYLILQLIVNVPMVVQTAVKIDRAKNDPQFHLTSIWSLQWTFDLGVPPSDATAIVISMLAVVIAVNIAAVAATINTPQTLTAETALSRWLDRMGGLAWIASVTALAVAATRFPGDFGLGVVLMCVGLIAMLAANLEPVQKLRNQRADVRVTAASVIDSHVGKTLRIYRRLRSPRVRTRLAVYRPDRSSPARFSLIMAGMLILALIIEAFLSTVFSTALAASRSLAQADSLRVFAYMLMIDSVTTAPLLVYILWGSGLALIRQARQIAGAYPRPPLRSGSRHTDDPVRTTFHRQTMLALATLSLWSTFVSLSAATVYGAPAVIVAAAGVSLIHYSRISGRGPGKYVVLWGYSRLAQHKKATASWFRFSKKILSANHQ